jgi:hypothetical protein
MMGAKRSPIVPFVPPSKRSSGDVSEAPASVTDAEQIVIRMLARRAARRWLAAMTAVGTSQESKHR